MKATTKGALALVLGLVISTAVHAGGGAEAKGTAAPAASGGDSALAASDQARVDEYFVSVDWLKANYDKVVVFDARTKAEYDKGHLPGAVRKHWTETSNTTVKQNEKGWSVILPPDQLAKIFGDLGIDGKKTIVVYTDPDNGASLEGRALWTFRVFGLGKSYILNGGIKAWKAAGGATNTEETKPQAVTLAVPKQDWGLFVSTEFLAENLDKVKILDAREQAEYDGQITKGEKTKGRIPGSKHIWFKDFYAADGTLKTPAEIRALVSALGYGIDDPIVAYCTGGIRSALATIALRTAGYSKAANYDASFSEWAGTEQVIEKP